MSAAWPPGDLDTAEACHQRWLQLQDLRRAEGAVDADGTGSRGWYMSFELKIIGKPMGKWENHRKTIGKWEKHRKTGKNLW